MKSFFIKSFVLYFIINIISGCHQTGRVSIAHKRPIGRLLGANHLFTIKGDFSKPAGIAIDVQGSLYVSDASRSIIHVLDKDGNKLESIGRFGWKKGEFDNPLDVCLDSQLRLYIADTGNNRIQRFSLINRDFSVLVGKEQDESRSNFTLLGPQGISTDTRGFIYITDTWNNEDRPARTTDDGNRRSRFIK